MQISKDNKMKNVASRTSGVLFLLVVWLICFAGSQRAVSNEHWEVVIEKPGVLLLDMQFSDDGQTGWAVGNIGKAFGKKISVVLKTTDGGNTWEYLDIPQAEEVSATGLFFLTNDTGWIIGSNGFIIKTMDGGDTWATQSLVFTGSLGAIFFIDEATGWIVGSGNQFVLYKTTNGGESWENKSFGDEQFWLKDVVFVDENTGWVSGSKTAESGFIPIIMKTTDGGDHWSYQELPDLAPAQYSEIASLSFVSETTGWASYSSIWSTKRGSVLKTTDGGQSWEIAITTMAPYVYSVVAKDMQNIAFVASDFIWSTNNMLYVSQDAGDSWEHFTIPSLSIAYDLTWIDNHLFTLGRHSNVLRFDIQNEQWESVHMAMAIEDIAWITQQKGVVTSGNEFGDNKVLASTDGGQNWLPDNTMPGGNQVYFADENTGWFLKPGRAASVFRTLDGGSAWQEFPIGSSEIIASLKVVNPDNIWAFGAEGGVYQSHDQGESWTQVPSNTSLYVQSIHFFDEDTGWMAGGFGLNNGFINKTTDGGQTWTAQALPVNNHIRDVYFTGISTGFLLSYEGNLFKTNNGGEEWDVIKSFPGKRLEKILMLDDKYGYMSLYNEPSQGDGQGFVYVTEDGGESWAESYVSTLPNSVITQLVRKSPGELWATGYHNLVMRHEIPQRAVALASLPYDAGVLSGAGEYHIGEDVFVEISFSDEYNFLEWRDADGNVVSTEPAFTFAMPSTDVFLTAHLEASVDIPELNANTLHVYPNPAGDFFIIQAYKPIISVSLYDLWGRRVYVQMADGESHRVTSNTLESGSYLLKVRFEDGVEKRWVVIR